MGDTDFDVIEAKIEARCGQVTERLRTVDGRLDELERKAEDNNKMLVQLGIMTEKIGVISDTQMEMRKDQKELSSKITELEHKPMKSAEAMRSAAVSSAIGTLAGALVTGLVWLVATHGGL